MKNSASLSQAYVSTLEVPEDREFIRILHEGNYVDLKYPTPAKEIKCPRCLGSRGFAVAKDEWACLDEHCLVINSKATLNKQGSNKVKSLELKDVGVPEIYWTASFSDCHQEPELINQLKKFSNEHSGFVVMAGGVGLGKTYSACAAIRHYLYSRRSAQFWNVSDSLYRKWLEIKSSTISDAFFLDRLSEIEFLVLDDIGQFTPKEGFLDFLFSLVNRRAQKNGVGTIFTTNMNSREMEEKFGSPFTSRISGNTIIKFTGKDKRQSSRKY